MDAPHPSLGFGRRFATAGALLTLAEIAAVGLPLGTFFSFDDRQRAVCEIVALPSIAVAWLVWWVAMRVWRSPVDRALRRRRAGGVLTADEVGALYRASLSLPRRVAWLRAGLAGGIGLGVATALVRLAGFPPSAIATIGVVSFLHTLLVQVFRVLWWARELGVVRNELVIDVDPLRLFQDLYFPRLIRGSLATGALGFAAIGAFTYFFLPINLEQYVSIETWFPITAVSLTGIWYLLARRMVRPVDRYLVRALSVTGIEARDDALALAAYRAAQSIPYKFAVAKAAYWVVAEALLVVQGVLLWHIDLENGVLLFGLALVVTVGVAIYEALWHRATLRPLLQQIATQHRPRPDSVRTPLSLRNKMLLSFGGLTFFSCGLSLFWSFVQYKNLTTSFIQQSSELRLDRVMSDMIATAARAGRPLDKHDIARSLTAEARDEAVIYYLPPDDSRALALGGGKAGPPPLPWTGEALMRRLERGQMDLSTQQLSGAYARLYDSEHRDLGSIAVVYPGYRGRGSAIARQIKVLVFFFVVLVLASFGIVVLVVADLTGPIRLLEKRAVAMAQGDLNRPVVHVAGEADEVGRLTFAFEEMRRALNDKLRSSTEINMQLEQEVRRRTSELERRNAELAEALATRQRLQNELVLSEKMASMGRLVAGIAHEINNPVNAVVNTAGPLGATIDHVAPRLDKADVDEMQDMVRVIQNGARRTNEIVKALHNYSRGDVDRLVDVDLHRGLDESLDLLRHQIKGGIRVEKDYGNVGKVKGYPSQLQQVFLNLLTNGAQALVEHAANHADAPPGVLRIATRRDGDKVVITVADNGPGIPPELRARIFEPFFTTKDVGQGSGLGLSIVHGIVERHGGTIAVESEVGRGTTFTVTLPQG